MKKLTINDFDDVIEGDFGKWSQVCCDCSKLLDSETIQVKEFCSNDLICGVKGCNNEACYYVDFETKEESLKKTLDSQHELCKDYCKKVFGSDLE